MRYDFHVPAWILWMTQQQDQHIRDWHWQNWN